MVRFDARYCFGFCAGRFVAYMEATITTNISPCPVQCTFKVQYSAMIDFLMSTFIRAMFAARATIGRTFATPKNVTLMGLKINVKDT